MESHKRVFFTGNTGTGKSIIIQEYINLNIDKIGYAPIILNFSAQTSSSGVQKGIESKLEKKRGKKILGSKGNSKCLIFIDDINMPKVEQYGAQPPIEFLRLLIDKDIIYDRPSFFKKAIEDFQIICAAAPPGGGRAPLTPRFMRHFHVLNVPNASEEILTQIFDQVIESFLFQNNFSESVKKYGNISVSATIDMYT
jgi:dynein heavy chain